MTIFINEINLIIYKFQYKVANLNRYNSANILQMKKPAFTNTL
jgi:hypothetical protein